MTCLVVPKDIENARLGNVLRKIPGLLKDAQKVRGNVPIKNVILKVVSITWVRNSDEQVNDKN